MWDLVHKQTGIVVASYHTRERAYDVKRTLWVTTDEKFKVVCHAQF
jgi:hypothetical protein